MRDQVLLARAACSDQPDLLGLNHGHELEHHFQHDDAALIARRNSCVHACTLTALEAVFLFLIRREGSEAQIERIIPMSNNAFYITTSIPYVNAAPHVGFALELVQADTIARHRRLEGRDVRFQCGTDDNSLKNVRAAEDAGLPTADFVARNADRFAELGRRLDVSCDDFIRTSSDPRHAQCVHHIWNACAKRGDLYRKAYSGLYCVGCEQFYTAEELTDGLCPEHRTAPERVEEENWFFRLSRYGQTLLDLVERDELRIRPYHRRNEILSILRGGLEDISVSRSAARSRGWGVSVPGGDGEVVYVWIDALANYLSGLSLGDDSDLLDRYWNETEGERLHLVGKGISKFHAVYWPAILLSAGLPLPTDVLVHGYVTVDGRKIGKSAGNGVDPEPIVDAYGTPDALRYYLLRHIRSGEDGDFSVDRLETAWNSELGGQIGNLANRVLALLHKSFEGKVPCVEDTAFVRRAIALQGEVAKAIDAFDLHTALAEILAFAGEANKVFAEKTPWGDAKALAGALAVDERVPTERRLATTLAEQAFGLAVIGRCLLPFLPRAAAELHARLGIDPPKRYADPILIDGARTAPSAVLFPRREG